MEQLIELLTQIQELAGVGIEALQQALGAAQGGEGAPPEGAPPEGAPASAPPDEPPMA